MSSKVGNKPTIFEEKSDIARGCMEHRAIWLGLIYDEMKKAGVPNTEEILRKAVARCGQYQGGGMRDYCKGSKDCRVFSEVFMTPNEYNIFEAKVDGSEDALDVEFAFCPLVSGWQKLGFDDETIAKLCDIAMDGDRNIMKANGLTLDLHSTIAEGCPTCKMHIHR